MSARGRDSGFTLIETAVAAILVVIFALAFASGVDTGVGATRGVVLRQQATAIVNTEFEALRGIPWGLVAMSAVDPAAPMLDVDADTLLASESGLAADEVLASWTGGAIDPSATIVLDGQSYQVWRYVTHAGGGLRRLVVLVEWSDEGASESLLSGTLISEISISETTTTSSTSTTSTTSTSTTSTTSTTTTTTAPSDQLVVESITLSFQQPQDKQTAQVLIDDQFGNSVNGATVFGEWTTIPVEVGYPFSVLAITSGPGRATFTHNDGHDAGTTVWFCVTDVVLSGYTYSGGTQCVSGTWT